MKPNNVPLAVLTCLSTWLAPAALADGGFFIQEGVAADLAQTRQEVIIAFYRAGTGTSATDMALYVLRTRYTGTPPETLAWIIPLPATPADVVAHQNDLLFDDLDEATRPRFQFDSDATPSMCGCAASDLGTGGQNEIVVVEAQGQAGIFDWAALTSSGADALLAWLNQNGFAIPDAANDVLAAYIAQDMHFLAVRVREPEALETNGEGIGIPPIQFTCATSRRFYPMAISQISAATETEVLIYVLADHRIEAANIGNAVIDANALRVDYGSESWTNYEDLFADAISANNGLALITEYAAPWTAASAWVTAPPAVLDLAFLTRLRTVVARERMVVDFEFRDAATDAQVSPLFTVDRYAASDLAATLVAPLAMLATCTGFFIAAKRFWSRPASRNRYRPPEAAWG